MISRFTNLFKKTDGDELRAFQTRVVKILNELHPEISFEMNADPHAIESDGRVLGITNIHSAYLLSSKSENDLREIVSEHFNIVLANWDVSECGALDWAAAKQLCMPQLMPKEFTEKLPLISFPFGSEIVLGFVIDSEKAYSYVTKDDKARWDIEESEIYDVAIENLAARSTGIEVNAGPSPNGFVVISTMDGFDAVRIVSPKIREFIGGVIGESFYFGVPNRDFLVCWEKNDDMDYHDRFGSQVSSDFDERPYPLSRYVFKVSTDGEIVQLENNCIDPRSAFAENN